MAELFLADKAPPASKASVPTGSRSASASSQAQTEPTAPKPKVSTKSPETKEPAPPAPKATEPGDDKLPAPFYHDGSDSASFSDSYYSDESGDTGSYLSRRSGKAKANRSTQTDFMAYDVVMHYDKGLRRRASPTEIEDMIDMRALTLHEASPIKRVGMCHLSWGIVPSYVGVVGPDGLLKSGFHPPRCGCRNCGEAACCDLVDLRAKI